MSTLPSVTPMIPTLVPKPFHRDGWVYEEKVDGYRMVAYKERDRVRLVSQRHRPRATVPRRHRGDRAATGVDAGPRQRADGLMDTGARSK